MKLASTPQQRHLIKETIFQSIIERYEDFKSRPEPEDPVEKYEWGLLLKDMEDLILFVDKLACEFPNGEDVFPCDMDGRE